MNKVKLFTTKAPRTQSYTKEELDLTGEIYNLVRLGELGVLVVRSFLLNGH